MRSDAGSSDSSSSLRNSRAGGSSTWLNTGLLIAVSLAYNEPLCLRAPAAPPLGRQARDRLPRVPTPPAQTFSLPLARLLDLTADAVQAVQGGRSLNDVLARCPAEARPGVQALSFHVLRWLGGAIQVRAAIAPKTPPPNVDALLCTAWRCCGRPTSRRPTPSTRWSTRR